jgi:septal ring factor EnvC (AmiA/AmiB activator)
MTWQWQRGVLVSASIGTACAALLAQSPDRSRTEALSRRADERLQRLHEEADRLASEERSLLTSLRQLELEQEIRRVELEGSRDAVRRANADLARLDAQVAALTAEAATALPDFQARIVSLYKLGRGSYARLLLSASDLHQFVQAVRLVSALAEQDRRRLAEQRARLTQLAETRAAAVERQKQVRELESKAEAARVEAERAIARHTALVHDIDTRRDLNAQYSSELLAAQQRLHAVLAGSAGSDTASLPLAPFKGDLDWPVSGSIRTPFGTIVGSRPPLTGIEIASPGGAPAHAVHEGTVVFADAFTGFGRLVIVDHGRGTFTLYGNLAEIDVRKGERVDRGTDIGTAGLAADGTPTLYFELRVDGRAVDPLQWLTKR